jgi:tetratricopeptide (TPR) repeat protein
MRCLWILALGVSLLAPAPDEDVQRCMRVLDRGDFARARLEAGALVRTRPKSAEALVLLAQAELGSNNSVSALQLLQQALALEPNHVDALYYISKLTAILSQQEFGSVLQLDPDGVRAHQIAGEILAAQGKNEEAEREYRKALEKRPGLTAVLLALGDLSRSDGQYEAALEWYGKAAVRDPNNYDAVYGAGASLWFLKRTAEAEKQFRRALEIEPSSVAAKLALGDSLLGLGKAELALQYLEPPAVANPSIRRLQFVLARAYRALGRETEANRAFARYRQLTQEQGETELKEFSLEVNQ